MTDAYAPHIERDEQGPSLASEAQERPSEPSGAQMATIDFGDPASPRAAEERRDVRLCGICRKPVLPRLAPGGKPKKHCSRECRRIAWERAHPGRRGWQAALPGASRVERRFAEWIQTEDGEVVEAEVVRRARALQAAGRRHYGIAGIWEAVRYDQTIALQGEAGAWRLNNSYRSLLARKVMAENADLRGFFETRDLRGVA